VFDERSFATISFSVLSFFFGESEQPATRPTEGAVLRYGGRSHPDRLRIPVRRKDDDDILVMIL
jgi:hypothetical protein